MRLVELFDAPASPDETLRQNAIDTLTPFMAQGFPFVPMHVVVKALQGQQSGIDIDAGFVMKLLDPTQVQAVSKIEGDRIYLAGADDPAEDEQNQDEAEDKIQKVKDNAIKQAQADVKQPKAPPPPKPAAPPPPPPARRP